MQLFLPVSTVKPLGDRVFLKVQIVSEKPEPKSNTPTGARAGMGGDFDY